MLLYEEAPQSSRRAMVSGLVGATLVLAQTNWTMLPLVVLA